MAVKTTTSAISANTTELPISTPGQLGSLSVSPISDQIQAAALPLGSSFSTAVKVHEKVGARGVYVVTQDLIATHSSLSAPRYMNLASREITASDFTAFHQSGIIPASSSNTGDALSDDIIMQVLKGSSVQKEIIPSSTSATGVTFQTQVRHIPGSHDLSLRITEIADHPSLPVLVSGDSEERIVSEADFDRLLAEAATCSRKDDSLESILAEKGLSFSKADDMQIQTVGGPGYILDKYLFDPISKGLHWIQHKGNSLFDSQYREQYKYAVKECQKERYRYEVYSKDQIDAQLVEVSQLALQAYPHIRDKAIADIFKIAAAGSRYLPDFPGSAVIKALCSAGATISSLRLQYESQGIIAEWDKESSTLRDMIEKNRTASYHRSLKTNYEPVLYYKSELTKEEQRMAAWGVDFVIDNNGFQFGISHDTSF